MFFPALDSTRRQALRTFSAGLVGIGATLSGCADIIPQGLGLALTPSPLTDPPVFNFALNLEYLEAEYYQRGVNGVGLPPALIGPSPGPVNGGRQVAFQTPYVREFLAEIAEDELNHVRFIRQTIKASPLIEISRPAIDLANSFRKVGAAAGLGDNFDPFADEASFLLGAFLFEDVGVTAYIGGSDLIAGPDSAEAAAGILAVEAYHGGLIRTQIADMGPAMVSKADSISAARSVTESPDNRPEHIGTYSGPVRERAINAGGVFPGEVIISPTDPQGRCFARPPQDVLNIVYLDPREGIDRGGFFPGSAQGVVTHSMLETQSNLRRA
ncbi:MAG TPA: ferritin-like domain-containing protein [Sphingomicrobium sp.]|nr:ferritin-like domain-containing protein [Sphingomicrobium sp.]